MCTHSKWDSLPGNIELCNDGLHILGHNLFFLNNQGLALRLGWASVIPLEVTQAATFSLHDD